MRKYLLFGSGALALSALIIIAWIVLALAGLPDVSFLKQYRPPSAAEVLDKDGSFLTHYYDRKFRIWAPLSGLPDIVIHAVVIAEDDTFFEHHGVNYRATWDAMVHDVQKHRFARGGSTITQQMIKNVLLSREKTISRKVREYVLARKAEEILTKRQILEIYLNEVEWGDNIYGIEAASRFYLDKHAAELTPAEASLLAGMLPSPRHYNPYKHGDNARERQERVLFNLQQAKLITPEEYAAALSAPLTLRPEEGGKLSLPGLATKNGRPCYQHALEKILVALFSEPVLYRTGGTVKTTLDRGLQEELQHWEESQPGGVPDNFDRITVVSQGEQIRAIVCAEGREPEVRSKLELLGPLCSGCAVATVLTEAVRRDQIILSPGAEVK
jgi:monofunctional biosynthetic peptidoglycan transglycosylase